MTQIFKIDDEIHGVGDAECPACPPEYPEPCACGGLMHAGGEAEIDGEMVLATQCDRCGCSLDDLGSEVA